MLWGCQRLYHWIGQKILSCFHVKHFEIDPTVPKLDIEKCQSLRFKSQPFQTIFGRNFLRDALGLWVVLPLEWAENFMLFSRKTLLNWPSGSKVTAQVVNCTGQQFISPIFKACFGVTFYWILWHCQGLYL